ncbi:hypothetical protein MTO96_044556, partial [Rhipicephalus appendiculatus]
VRVRVRLSSWFCTGPQEKRNRCVKAANCALRCPNHSKFQFCVSTCAPKCGQRTSGNCATRCQRGGCVCDPGYAEVEQNGETICVPQGECSRYIVAMPALAVGRPGLVGGGFSSVGAAGGSTTTGTWCNQYRESSARFKADSLPAVGPQIQQRGLLLAVSLGPHRVQKQVVLWVAVLWEAAIISMLGLVLVDPRLAQM